MDETYIRIKGRWMYPYRAVDKTGGTVDFFFSAHLGETAARFSAQADPSTWPTHEDALDGSGTNCAAVMGYNRETRA